MRRTNRTLSVLECKGFNPKFGGEVTSEKCESVSCSVMADSLQSHGW